MCTQESGNAVRCQDGVNGWPVLWVCLKHLLDQIQQLIGQMTGEGGGTHSDTLLESGSSSSMPGTGHSNEA